MMEQKGYAAIFLDFENIFYTLVNSDLPDDVDASDAIVELVRGLREHMLEAHGGHQCIVQHAYADFQNIGGNVQGALYLSGVETHNVVGTDHKNAADMLLCIHAMETMYTRSEIETFVLIAGDRDYIPVIQHLKKHAKTVIVVALENNLSGDLRLNVGEEFFVDASKFLSDSINQALRQPRAPVRTHAVVPDHARVPSGARTEPAPFRELATKFESVMEIKETGQLEGLEILLRHFGHHSEVFLVPYLHKLRNEMPQLAEYERKALVSSLVSRGAVALEKRHGEPNDYSVLILNWDHPDVREANPGGD